MHKISPRSLFGPRKLIVRSLSLVDILPTVVFALGFFTTTGMAYAATPTITSAKINGPNTALIIYSEAVNSALADYTNFSGALNGRHITAVSVVGSNTITLTFDGNAFPADAVGGLSVATTTVSMSDNALLLSGDGVYIADGQAPALVSIGLSSNNANNTFAKIGAIVTLSFRANEPLANPALTISGRSVGANGDGSVSYPYSASYSVGNSDTEEVVPVAITLSDFSGNTAKIALNLSTGSVAGTLPSIAPITSDVTSNAVLKIGDTITFTLTPTVAVPDATVSGSYNGVPLNWITPNGGVTYTATYGVAKGNNDQTRPLQITGVTLTTASGVTNAPASGSDVQKTIDAHPPIIVATVAAPASAIITPVPVTNPAPGLIPENFKFSRALSAGSTGTDVRALQKRLMAEGIFSGSVNGHFGPATRAAVQKYQSRHGLPQLGSVGPGTRAALNK